MKATLVKAPHVMYGICRIDCTVNINERGPRITRENVMSG
jgi:hypothetical protein